MKFLYLRGVGFIRRGLLYMADVLHINMGFLIENILEKLGTQIDI
jgi:hypothetical protein